MSDESPRMRESFVCAPGLRIEAHEQIAALQFAQVNTQLGKLEGVIERLDRRLWLTVYGVVGVVLTQAVLSVMGLE